MVAPRLLRFLPHAGARALSVDLITEKEDEKATDIGETLLIMGLLAKVQKDDYYETTDLINATYEFAEVLARADKL